MPARTSSVTLVTVIDGGVFFLAREWKFPGPCCFFPEVEADPNRTETPGNGALWALMPRPDARIRHFVPFILISGWESLDTCGVGPQIKSEDSSLRMAFQRAVIG